MLRNVIKTEISRDDSEYLRSSESILNAGIGIFNFKERIEKKQVCLQIFEMILYKNN